MAILIDYCLLQVYLKLERYDDVLKDCETALKVREGERGRGRGERKRKGGRGTFIFYFIIYYL